MQRRLVIAVASAALVAAAMPAGAAADEVIEAQVVWRFDASSYTIDQGEPLLFRNSDAVSPGPHNVTASDNGPDGRPLFASETIQDGEESPVNGARALTTGSYPFICTVHPFMQATLEVTDQGTPVTEPPASQPPPGPAADTTAPSLELSLRGESLRARSFRGMVTSDEPADLRARLSARVGRRRFSVGTASARAAEAGRRVKLTIRASKAARRKLRRARRATLTLAVEARDAAGNVGTATARRRFRR